MQQLPAKTDQPKPNRRRASRGPRDDDHGTAHWKSQRHDPRIVALHIGTAGNEISYGQVLAGAGCSYQRLSVPNS
jgi:hypothetical protein